MCRRWKAARVAAVVLVWTAVSSALAVDYTWTGNNSSDWGDSATWNPNGVPGTGDTVTFNRVVSVERPAHPAGAWGTCD